MMGSEVEETPARNPKEETVATKSSNPGAKRKTAKSASRKSAVAATKPAKPKIARKQTSQADRSKILDIAQREGLTALQVQKRYGVKPVTYYSWRKKRGLKGPRGRRPANVLQAGKGVAFAGQDVAGQVRQALRAEIARVLPTLIQEEVAAMIGGSSSNGRRRK